MDATSPDTDSAELSVERDFEPFLREMVIVGQDFGDSVAALVIDTQSTRL